MPHNFELYDLRVTVTAIEGRSVCSMQVGDYFDLVAIVQHIAEAWRRQRLDGALVFEGDRVENGLIGEGLPGIASSEFLTRFV